jgi:hypothetical protein
MDLLGKFGNNMQPTNLAMIEAGKHQVAQKRHTDSKEIERQEPQHSTEEPKGKAKEEKDTFQSSGAKGGETPKTHQKKTNQVLRHFISQTDAKKKIDKQKETEKSQNAKDSKGTKGAEQEQSKVPLDNASRIGLMYQQQMRKQKQKGESRVDRGPQNEQQQQQAQMKRFLANVRDFVKTEYKQYTRPEISPYSRRNLREILSALGDEVKAFDNKIGKDRRNRQKGIDDDKFFNRHYAVNASRNLKLFTDDPMMDGNYEPMEMIA